MNLKIARDMNGNKILKVKTQNGRGFSVQTLGNLPETHRNGEDIDAQATIKELYNHVREYGTSKQQDALK